MSKATPMRIIDQSNSDEYRKRLRSSQTPLRRSPRFSPQSNNATISAKKQLSSIKKPSLSKTHVQFLPISPTPTQISNLVKTHEECLSKYRNEPLRPIRNLQGSLSKTHVRIPPTPPTPTHISNPVKTHEVCLSKCPSEPLRPIGNLQGSLRRSRRLSSVMVEPIKERRRSTGILGFTRVLEGKEKGKGDVKEMEILKKENILIDGSRDNFKKENGEKDELLNLKMNKRKIDKNCEEKIGRESEEKGECCGVGEWTKEQDAALQRAYLVAKPSPHFWKKVAKMVPGKSQQECFDRVNKSFDTPPQPQPRSRSKRANLSPIPQFTLSSPVPIQQPIPLPKKLSSRRKTLVAQKTIRHLLRKHSINDQNQETDHYKDLEPSPARVFADLPEMSPPPVILSSGHKKMLSRFRPLDQANGPSPEVLKRIKNMALHEKYINQLHNREAKRLSAAASGLNRGGCKIACEINTGIVKAAKIALVSEAKEVISQFQCSQSKNECDVGEDADEDEDVDDEDE